MESISYYLALGVANSPFFFRVRMACALTRSLIFLPSTTIVFFCKLGSHTFFVCRCEKLTLLPNCFPFPVMSHTFIIANL